MSKVLGDYLYYHEDGPPSMDIYLGDSAEVLPLLQGGVDLVLTSPPYDALREYLGYTFDFEKVASGLVSCIRDGRNIVWIVGDGTVDGSESGTSFRQALKFMDLGMKLHDTMIYEKPGPPFPDFNRYYQVFEYMFIFSKGKPLVTNLICDRRNIYAGAPIARLHGDRQADGTVTENSAYRIAKDRKTKEIGVRFNVWRMPTSGSEGNHLKTEHPATFPDRLAKDHILSWSNEGEIVLDPFLGSGTTLVACKELRRSGIGIEISATYAEIAKKRLLNTQVPFL